ncbi:MAG: DUF2914 domain-containing protein [Desulfobacteraceae bacterium]|nr:DUF2914 domain-containing protein [Desulfobacteraceae bacterium]
MKNLTIMVLLVLGSILVSGGLCFGEETNPVVQIEDAAICQDVADRAPVGGGDVFPKEVTRLFCFTRVVGAETETEITHNWYYKGSLQASVVLNVGSKNWRTWSSKSFMPGSDGEWMVEVLSKDGVPLESIIFFIQ